MFSTDEEQSAGPIVPAGLHLASLGRRAGGIIIDQALIAAPVFGGFYLAGFNPADALAEGRSIWFTIAITTLGLAYETVGVWRWGRTLGKLITGTRVVRVEDGGGLGFTRAFQRSLVPTTVSAIPQVGMFFGIGIYVWAFFDPLRQGIHDKAAASIVVFSRPR